MLLSIYTYISLSIGEINSFKKKYYTFVLLHMFLLLVHLHWAVLVGAVSTSFCHFSLPQPLALSAETVQLSSAILPEHCISFPSPSPFD